MDGVGRRGAVGGQLQLRDFIRHPVDHLDDRQVAGHVGVQDLATQAAFVLVGGLFDHQFAVLVDRKENEDVGLVLDDVMVGDEQALGPIDHPAGPGAGAAAFDVGRSPKRPLIERFGLGVGAGLGDRPRQTQKYDK